MLERLRGLAALGVVLAVPFLLRPQGDRLDEASETVVVITPHNEAIRYEFGRAFREHMRITTGRSVRVDWRTPGGGSEIARYLASEYTSSFERYWTHERGRPWTSYVASAFANPSVQPNDSASDEHAERLARRMFLGSTVSSGIDVLFGGGSADFITQAAAGRLVDSGILRSHPELFGAHGIPQSSGGEPYWDQEGRWVGACLSGFGICYNQGTLDRLGISTVPQSLGDLADPVFFGQIALADPSKSGSAVKSFEMIIQHEMGRPGADPGEGWDRALRLIRRISGNARYFTDAGAKIPLDIAMGDAAAGMCIDFYGRFQSEASVQGGPSRLAFAAPRGETSVGSDPIGLLRGAPHPDLALAFLDFVLSPEGQKLWNFKVGTPGGPTRYALRRLPIWPGLYEPAYAPLRADPNENPYRDTAGFIYHAAWTGPLFRVIAFIVRTMCVDTQDELSLAYRALAAHGFPAQATALFDDVSMVNYAAAQGPLRAALASPDPVDEAELTIRLVRTFRQQYQEVTRLAQERM